MTKPLFIARQSAHPQGWFGHLVAHVMSWETAGVNRRALGALDLDPTESVLEVGCGHGRTLSEIAGRWEGVTCTGVDPSEVMLRVARRRCRRWLASAQIVLEQGTAARLPFPEASFDRVLTVHTTYFWPDLETGLTEIRRVLRPGGRLVVAFRPADDPGAIEAVPSAVYRLDSGAEMRRALLETGFSAVELDAATVKGVTTTLAIAQ